MGEQAGPLNADKQDNVRLSIHKYAMMMNGAVKATFLWPLKPLDCLGAFTCILFEQLLDE